VTLHAEHESLTRLLEPLYKGAARRVGKGRGTQRGRESLWAHRLMVIAVHRERCGAITEDLRELGATLHIERMRECRRCWIRCANLPLNMLQQRTTTVHIQELQSATDAKNRNATAIGGVERGPLQRIARWLNVDSAIVGLGVARRINVGATREEQAVHLREGGGALLVVGTSAQQNRNSTSASNAIGVARID
jgi:hypothetical protein